jgi:hypothetical protein
MEGLVAEFKAIGGAGASAGYARSFSCAAAKPHFEAYLPPEG